MAPNRIRMVDRLALNQVTGDLMWWGTLPPDNSPRWYNLGVPNVADTRLGGEDDLESEASNGPNP